MRILWLAPYPPRPPFHGGKLRLLNLVNEVVALGNRVDLWCVSPGELPSRSGSAAPAISSFPQRSGQGLVRRVQARVSALPKPAWTASARDMRLAVESIEPGSYDIAVLEQAHMGPYLPTLTAKRIPVVLDAQNVETLLTQQLMSRESRIRGRAGLTLDAWKFGRLEADLFRSTAAVVTTSEPDRERVLTVDPSAAVHVVPSGVDLSYFQWHDHVETETKRCVMTGTLGYQPNADAAFWLRDEILPELRRLVPGACVTLVGQASASLLEELDNQEDGFRVVGPVPDVRPYLVEADVFVMPLRMGSGTRLKALEALASGLPLVSTKIGVEGLELAHGEHVLVADSPGCFAARIRDALEDRALRSRLIRAGRSTVETHYDWGLIGKRFSSVLLGAANGTTA